jgi:hypothetical protein
MIDDAGNHEREDYYETVTQYRRMLLKNFRQQMKLKYGDKD